jgi:hypothetical protein
MPEPCHSNPGTVTRFAEANLLMQASHGANRLYHIQPKRMREPEFLATPATSQAPVLSAKYSANGRNA